MVYICLTLSNLLTCYTTNDVEDTCHTTNDVKNTCHTTNDVRHMSYN